VNTSRTAVALAAALMLVAGTANAQARQRVVYQVNTGDATAEKTALLNIQNHVNAVGKDNIDLRVVVHWDGVLLLQRARNDENIKAAIDKLKLLGVTFEVAADALSDRHLDYRTDLYDVSADDVVPNGIAEIAALQMKGYAYVKP
jgi:intracellular sulfur oxidation DsrE/DsrF family protein